MMSFDLFKSLAAPPTARSFWKLRSCPSYRDPKKRGLHKLLGCATIVWSNAGCSSLPLERRGSEGERKRPLGVQKVRILGVRSDIRCVGLGSFGG